MTPKKNLNIRTVAALLRKRGLLSEEQHALVLEKGESQARRLQKYQEAAMARRFHTGPDFVSPAEVISSFNLEIPGGNGRFLTEDAITEVIAQAVGMEYLKLDPLKLDLDTVTGYIPRPFALRHLIVPVEVREGVVTLAVADPFDTDAIESLQTSRKMTIRRVLSSRNDILKIVREFYGFRASVTAATTEMTQGPDLGNLEQLVRLKAPGEMELHDNKYIVNAVDYLFHYAFEQRASDIHIEPKREKSFVRLRVDGTLHYIHTIPKQLHASIVSRIKMLSRMDITEKRRPQDGRIKTVHRSREIELRISTLPVAFGEKVVIRIFDPEVLMQDLDGLGFYPREFQLYNSFIRRPHGIILVTGPTGSGKTTTLYSSLRALSSPDVNIVTIEDPIELVTEEFNQVGVQQATGVTFDVILRNILRQDPDIIMVGEIRDRETAESAVQSALTGHLVFSTVHTNDAPSSVTRLLDLGIPSFLITSTVIGIIAQRLVRKICPSCRASRPLTPEEAAHLGLERRTATVSFGEGCTECRGTGYRGRTGIFEVMDITENVKRAISDRTDPSALAQVARGDGMISLRQVAIMKMLEGITTYEEVVSMTG
jgi:general secretion pathway protein E